MSSQDISLIDTPDRKGPRALWAGLLKAVPRLVSWRSREVRVTRGAKKTRLLAALFTQMSLAFVFLWYPVFLHLGANSGSPDVPAKEQFDICGLLSGEPAQSCGVSTRFAVRWVQAAAEDQRACAQASRVSKFVYHPLRIGSWDEASLNIYATYYWEDGRLSKWIKARVADYMLSAHHEMDAKCNS